MSRLQAAGIPARVAYRAPWPPGLVASWLAGFPVVVPESRLKDAADLLEDAPSSARPILPRVLALLVLIAFVAPLLVSAVGWLTR